MPSFKNLTRRMNRSFPVSLSVAVLVLGGCATESHRTIEPERVVLPAPMSGKAKLNVSIGNFSNRSLFMRGLFNDGVDRLGSQAKTILIAHLNQSERFSVLDRENMSAAMQEAQISNKPLTTRAATYLITGDVTEFGRKEIGDRQLFGILGRGKEQIAYAKVTLNLVRVDTSEVILSVQGSGEYSLSNREVVGFGGTASYDSTLNGKVLDLAIRQSVERLAQTMEAQNLQ